MLFSGVWKKPAPELQKCIDQRFKICSTCPHFKVKSYMGSKLKRHTCNKCGCSFPAMLFAYNKRCPDRRWDAIPEDAQNFL